MHLYAIGIIKDAHPLTTPTIIPMDYRINDCLTQHFNGILGEINPLPSLNARSYRNIAIKKCFSAIDDLLERSCHNFAVSVPTGPNGFPKQHTHYLALWDMILWTQPEKEYASICRNDCPTPTSTAQRIPIKTRSVFLKRPDCQPEVAHRAMNAFTRSQSI